jgi:hypothetical protein
VSRRQPSPPEKATTARRFFSVKVCCSDRGQHARVVLHHLHDVRSFGIGLPPVTPIGGARNGVPLSPYGAEDGCLRYRFRCPRCQRDVQLREEKLLAIVSALSANDGHPVLDISLLPC